MRGLSLVAASGGHSSSRCTDLSLSRPLLLWSTGSRRAGSVVVAHGPSCSAARGIFPDRGSNPCALHWQADSQPLRHQGSPTIYFFMGISVLSERESCGQMTFIAMNSGSPRQHFSDSRPPPPAQFRLRELRPRHRLEEPVEAWSEPVNNQRKQPSSFHSQNATYKRISDLLVSLNSFEVQVHIQDCYYQSFSVHGRVTSLGEIEIPSGLP